MNNHITDTILLCTLIALSSATQATTGNNRHQQDDKVADNAANIMSADKVFAGLIEKHREAAVAEVRSDISAKKPSHKDVVEAVQSKQVVEAKQETKPMKEKKAVSADKAFAGLFEKRQEVAVAGVDSNPSAKKPSHKDVVESVQSKQVVEAKQETKPMNEKKAVSADKAFAGLFEKRQETAVAEVHSDTSVKKHSHKDVVKVVQSKQVVEAKQDAKPIKKPVDASSKTTLLKKDDVKVVAKASIKRGRESQSNINDHVDRSLAPAVSAVKNKRAVGKSTSYTVRGKRYRTLAHSDGFVQTGKASWYGKRFHGRKTASGERFDMNALTAAHKELPLGTKIEVVNNDNGKRVVVTVNDRGPFHGDRVLDLSKAAAKQIGAIERGTANVTIRAL